MHKSIQNRTCLVLLAAVLCCCLLSCTSAQAAKGVEVTIHTPDSGAPTLTYTRNKLVWDRDTDIDDNGVAVLDLFSADYGSIVSEDGTKVIAPNSVGSSTVRLKNAVQGSVTYTAVVYSIRTNEDIPVTPMLEDDGFEKAENAPVPEGVLPEQIIASVGGKLAGSGVQDFTIHWFWPYESDEKQDEIDTALGNAAAEGTETVTVGIYIVVEDNNKYPVPNTDDDDDDDGSDGGHHRPGQVKPEPPPHTGDDTNVELYAALAALSLSMLVLLTALFRRSRK